MPLHEDFKFALECPEEFVSRNGGFKSPLLRYVAALNPEATVREFIEAAAHFDFNPKTVAIQFAQSRRFDLVTYPEEWAEIDKEGRLVAINDPT